MKTSLSSFLYFNYPLEEAIQRTAKAGYDGIDIWGGRPHAYRRDLSRDETAGLRRLLADSNLEVASFIPAQFRYPTCLCSKNDTIRLDSVEYIKDSIQTASELGAPLVSVCPGHSLYGQGADDAWGRLGESLDAICEFAAENEVLIALEPADRYETDLMPTTTDALRMIRELEHENLGVLLDNGHAYVVGESSVDAVSSLRGSLFHVHIDDNDGARDQHLIPGEGNFDFAPFIAALRDAGYEGFLSAELGWDYTVDPDPAAHATAMNLRKMLA
jgi:protein FrlC